MKLDGLKIKNYRSFDKEGIVLEDFGKVNIFIGKNNCGKSNILSFINLLKTLLFRSTSNRELFLVSDYHNFLNSEKITFSIQYKKESEYDKILESVPIHFKSLFENINNIFIDFNHAVDDKIYSFDFDKNQWLKNVIKEDNATNELFLKQFSGSGPYLGNLKNIIASIKIPTYEDIGLINTHREIQVNRQKIDKNSDTYRGGIYNGFDLIDRLDSWKDPRPINQNQRKHFDEIENFIRDILNENELTLEISSDDGYGKELSLKIRGKQIPIENLGTGIHQLIILASTVTVLQDYLICVEEPEIFVHPEIQRKFLKYILKTKNQYFITTHSNTFLNVDGIDVYHISYDGTKSSAKKVITSTEKNILLSELGYQASDLLQANYLLWVEGPSDRIYITHWLKSINRNLSEGIHYSIMFYGGRLLSHLSADEKALNDFIKLNRINRNIGIVIDSDKKEDDKDINQTKQRIANEFNENNFFTWITKGKEIENYISENNLFEAIRTVTSDKDITIEYGQFKSLNVYTKDGRKKEIDKILLARSITKIEVDINVLDLKERLNNLVLKIKEANNL